MQALRQIPPINDILKAPELEHFRHTLGQSFITSIINSVVDETRRELAQSPNGASRDALTTKIATEVAKRLARVTQSSLRRVINATGVVLHTNLGRAPLPKAAIEQLQDVVSGYSNLEFDVDQGSRGKRDTHVGRILEDLLGCEAAVVVNNNAAAVLLVLNTLGEGGEVIVSRGEQVEIGESFRIPDILARSGSRLREVGSTNRTRIKDYESAINEHTRLLLRVHPSNFRIIGFTERPSLEEFVDLGRRRTIPTFEDLGSGCLVPIQALEGSEPVVSESIRAGVDIVSFSGDKLMGGPQAGIIAGKKIFVDRIRNNPLFRALRVDKLTIAVLDYVLRAYFHGKPDAVPTWASLNTPTSELRTRAETFAQQAGSVAVAIPLQSVVGGGSAPETYIPSWGVSLEFDGLTPVDIEEQLRRSTPPVIARVEDGRVILDFRTVFSSELPELLEVVRKIGQQNSVV
jgi:L-seryl-tRNA(Ser) seleniumtransferase